MMLVKDSYVNATDKGFILFPPSPSGTHYVSLSLLLYLSVCVCYVFADGNDVLRETASIKLTIEMFSHQASV